MLCCFKDQALRFRLEVELHSSDDEPTWHTPVTRQETRCARTYVDIPSHTIIGTGAVLDNPHDLLLLLT